MFAGISAMFPATSPNPSANHTENEAPRRQRLGGGSLPRGTSLHRL